MEQASQYKFIVRLKKHQDAGVVKGELEKLGIVCGGGVYDVPCHRQPVFAHIKYDIEDVEISEYLCSKHVCPPITSGTTDEDAEIIGDSLIRVLV